MFEDTLLDALTNHTELTAYLSTYTDGTETSPAIFSNSAPAKAEFIYLVFRINDIGNIEDSAIDIFDVMIDLFGYSKSGVNERLAVKKIDAVLDKQSLTNDDYFDNIRFKKTGIFFVDTDDIKSQHYHIKFEARAGRSGWMSNL